MDYKRELDTIKDEYLNPTPDRRFDQKIIELVSDFVVSRLTSESILELGVGDQIWTPKLLDRFEDVRTIDGSAELLSAMQKKLIGRHWTQVLSLFEEYQPDHRFDNVLATYILEHVCSPSLILSMARHKWLKDDRKLAVAFPHAISLHRRLAVKMGLASCSGEPGDVDRRVRHKQCFTCYEMEKLIIEAGFQIVEKKRMFTKVLPNSMLVHCSDEQLRGMFEFGFVLPIEQSAVIYFLVTIKSR